MPQKVHPKVRNCIRVVVALRDWGPLYVNEIMLDTVLERSMVIYLLSDLRRIGWVRKVKKGPNKGAFRATLKTKATTGGQQFFGYMAPRVRRHA